MKQPADKGSGLDDFLLITRIRMTGNREAFGRLVERYQSPLRRYLLQLTRGDSQRTDDLAQESFVKAFESIKQLSTTGSFRAWLFRIAYRTFLDDCRSLNVGARRALGLGTEADFSAAGSEGSCEMATLDSMLAPLDDAERNLMLLAGVEQLSHSQIAEITGMPLGSVKTTILRAKNKLRDHLGGDR